MRGDDTPSNRHGDQSNRIEVHSTGWTVSVEPGYDVIEKLGVFLKARQNVGKCFIFSATGRFSEAELVNLNEDGKEETFHMPLENGHMVLRECPACLGTMISR